MSRIVSLLSLLALVAGALVTLPATVLAQTTCPATMPVSEIVPGATGYGLTVSRGTTPERFDVTVVDVLDNAIAPGLPLIVVEVDSPEIDRVGGIWAGMSGSPVYIGERLIGAVGYGFSFGPSKLGGVTPAAAMLAVPDRPTLSAAQAADEVDLSARVQAQAREEGFTTAQARSMSQLRVPVGISGIQGDKFERFATAFERANPNTSVFRSTGGTATAAAAGAIVPGGNLAVSLAYGDYNAVGVGTVTTVCDGVVTGFGHPMLYDGATRLGMHSASAVRIVDDPVFGPYKLANAGPPVGTIDQDRLAAVAGRVGPLPQTTAIRTSITNRNEQRTVTGRTDSVAPDGLFGSVLVHGWINYDSLVFDDFMFAGTSTVSWTLRGLRADGAPWSLTRENRHASRFDLSSESLFEAAITTQLLDDNPFEQVRVTSVDYTATAGAPYKAYEIQRDGVTVSMDGSEFVSPRSGVDLVPGGSLSVRVPLRLYRSELSTTQIDLEVPADASGSGQLIIGNAQDGGGDIFECLWDPEYCSGPAADSFDDLLEGVRTRPRSDDLSVALVLYPEFEENPEFGFDGDVGAGYDEPIEPIVAVTKRLDEVVTGRAEFPASAPFDGGEGSCPVPSELRFDDVDPASTHADAIDCAFALGITRGISDDPPMFAPTRTVRRDAAASFVARLLEQGPKPLPEPADRFSDLGTNVHRDAIERLAAAGIVKGRTATTYDPRAEVTREQLASLLVEALHWSSGTDIRAQHGPHFEDVGATHGANVDAAYELGLMQGYADGTFRANRPTRRDQIATVLVRAYSSVAAG